MRLWVHGRSKDAFGCSLVANQSHMDEWVQHGIKSFIFSLFLKKNSFFWSLWFRRLVYCKCEWALPSLSFPWSTMTCTRSSDGLAHWWGDQTRWDNIAEKERKWQLSFHRALILKSDLWFFLYFLKFIKRVVTDNKQHLAQLDSLELLTPFQSFSWTKPNQTKQGSCAYHLTVILSLQAERFRALPTKDNTNSQPSGKYPS